MVVHQGAFGVIQGASVVATAGAFLTVRTREQLAPHSPKAANLLLSKMPILRRALGLFKRGKKQDIGFLEH